jgi:hypothetical protein
VKSLRRAHNSTFFKFVCRGGNRLLLAFFTASLLPIMGLCLSPEEALVSRNLNVISPHRIAAAAAGSGQQDYGTFSHGTRAHADINCNSCHQRSDNSITPRFAGHSACVSCHLTQFVTPQSQMCMICHSSVQSSPAPMRPFPASFNERFNMKFDHAAHNRGAGRPAEGCVACHKPLRAGVALSIPSNLTAHNQCYSCHTPNRMVGGRDIGSCNTCHSLGGYQRTSTNAAAFKANFKHSDHGARQRLGCADCHSVKAGAPQTRQVSSPIAAEHFSSARAMSCMTCHDDKRAFGERNFANCKRCHTQPSFNMIR